MNENVFLFDFQSILPSYHLKQNQIMEWLQKVHETSESYNKEKVSRTFPLQKIIERYSVKESLIEERYFECNDIFNIEDHHNNIYAISEMKPSGSSILERQSFFNQKAILVFRKFFENQTEPAHIIHVTCTGYISPSAPQTLVSEKKWKNTAITHAYHMGCYAALPSIRLAKSLSKDSKKNIDLVHTEMCSLHMNPAAHEPEQIVVQTLFADGHIRYKAGIPNLNQTALEIIHIKEKILPESLEDMTWVPADWGMKMTLSRDVPQKLRSIIKSFFIELAKEAHLEPEVLLKEAIFAIHPGGPKIIDSIKEELNLSESQISFSRDILKSRGNMSSATLPHIWEKILNSPTSPNTYIVSFAFGPGLTLFGTLLRKTI